MAGTTSRLPLRAALLSAAMAALLGACAGERDAAPAPAADPAPVAQQPDAAPQPATGSEPLSPADGGSADPMGPCKADSLQALVGQEANETLVAQATADSGATSVRVLGPDDVATMDFRGDRLTITTDARRMIQTLSCG